MKLFLVAAAALALATPAQKASAGSAPAPAVQAVDAQAAAYGRWLARLQAIQTPVESELAGLQPAWQQAMRAPDRSGAEAVMRPVLERASAAITRAEAQLAVLETPEFPGMALPEDVRPASLVRQTQQLNAEIRAAVATFRPLFDAIARNDAQAGIAAVGRTMDSVALVLDSQHLMLRGAMASTSREGSAWHGLNVRLLFNRAAARAVRAFPRDPTPRRDPSFAADMRAIAAQLDRTAGEGTALLDREIARFAPFAQDAAAGSLARRSRAVLTAGRPVFPIARDLAQLLNRAAQEGERGPITVELLQRLVSSMRPLKSRLDQIGLEEQAALAGRY